MMKLLTRIDTFCLGDAAELLAWAADCFDLTRRDVVQLAIVVYVASALIALVPLSTAPLVCFFGIAAASSLLFVVSLLPSSPVPTPIEIVTCILGLFFWLSLLLHATVALRLTQSLVFEGSAAMTIVYVMGVPEAPRGRRKRSKGVQRWRTAMRQRSAFINQSWRQFVMTPGRSPWRKDFRSPFS